MRMKNTDHRTLSENERDIYIALEDGPVSAFALAMKLDLLHPALLNTARLEEIGIVGRIGLTPTDVLHAEGTYSVWNVEAARVATGIYAKHLGMGFKAFIDMVRNKVTERLSTEILSKFVSEEMGNAVVFDCKVCSLLLNKILGKNLMPELDLKMAVKMPIIAIGAPVRTYFPAVASRLGAELVVPEHAEVANAIGAITGSIIETVEILIDPIYTPAGIDHYAVHTPMEKADFGNLKDAVAYAKSMAEKLSREKAIRAGASQQIEIRVEKSDQIATAIEGYGESNFLLESRIKAVAISKPDIFEKK